MIGKNVIELCPGEMWSAVQTYLNEKLLQPEHPVAVTGIEVRQDGYAQMFRVNVESLCRAPEDRHE